MKLLMSLGVVFVLFLQATTLEEYYESISNAKDVVTKQAMICEREADLLLNNPQECIKAASFSKNEVPTSIISVYKTYENYVAAMYYNASMIFSKQDKYFEKVKMCQKALEIAPDHDRTHLSLGLAYYDGEGISMNKYKAYEHWNIAAKQGNEVAQMAQMALDILCNESPWACK